MKNFKGLNVGDKLVVSPEARKSPQYVRVMDKFIDREMTISWIRSDYQYCQLEESTGFVWTAAMFYDPTTEPEINYDTQNVDAYLAGFGG